MKVGHYASVAGATMRLAQKSQASNSAQMIRLNLARWWPTLCALRPAPIGGLPTKIQKPRIPIDILETAEGFWGRMATLGLVAIY